VKHKMLLIYVDETDTYADLPLYEVIVRKLAQAGVAGATVQAGIMGFGKQRHVHRKRLFGISDDRPIAISVVDTEDAIRAVVPGLRPLVQEGLILLLDVDVLL
jgi:uncharacterized protein